jgi:hypothetical protein
LGVTEALKSLKLRNMPGYKMTNVFEQLPDKLEIFHVRNVPHFTHDDYKKAAAHLNRSTNLRELGIE